ncbi:hypothetical protein GOE07_05855 [Sinorhizobium medicae]|nr:hypothetical protein [Sinorhizobium medicae]
METAKERFAGANELALPMAIFEQEYPNLAQAVAEYASFFKLKNERPKYVLSVRLCAGTIENDGRFKMLRLFLRNPEGRSAHRQDFEEILLQALKANYERLLASGLYSPFGALDHARRAIKVFRSLGRKTPFYPELNKVLTLQRRKQNGPRKRKGVVVPFDPMSVEEIRSILGGQFHDDLLAYQGIGPGGPAKTIGFRYMMSCITLNPSSASDALLKALSGELHAVCDASTIKSLIEQCESALTRSRAFAPTSVTGWMRGCCYVFEHMSELPNRSYPRFSRRYKKFTHVPVEGSTIADLDFPPTRSLTGAAKLRASMQVVSDAAMDVVRRHASFFKAAAPMREGRMAAELPKSARAACAAISAVVRAEIRSFEETGHSQFTTSGVRTNSKSVDDSMKLLESPATWREAGLGELVPDVGSLAFHQIAALVMSCIGATHQAIMAAKIVFCCHTGWNRQSIEDIPSEVYQFRLVDGAGVASASFVSVFKNRAGHLVQALLEHSELGGVRATDAVAAWEEADRERPWAKSDQRCMVGYTSPAYLALELMRPLVESLDALSKDDKVHQRFFKSIAWAGRVTLTKNEISRVFKSGPLATPGLTFKLIRKSYLQMMFRVVDTVESLRTHAGHTGTGVLLPYYLNSPDVRRELEQSTRFFQNAVQSLVVAEVGAPLELLLTPEDHEWFYNLARTSGVASAVGYGVSTPLAGPPPFKFTPSDEQLRSLFALNMSLDSEEKTADPRRWALVGVALKGFILAILAKLKSVGMSRVVQRIGDQLRDDLRHGRVALPPLNLAGVSR